jgi:hypothetical protein
VNSQIRPVSLRFILVVGFALIVPFLLWQQYSIGVINTEAFHAAQSAEVNLAMYFRVLDGNPLIEGDQSSTEATLKIGSIGTFTVGYFGVKISVIGPDSWVTLSRGKRRVSCCGRCAIACTGTVSPIELGLGRTELSLRSAASLHVVRPPTVGGEGGWATISVLQGEVICQILGQTLGSSEAQHLRAGECFVVPTTSSSDTSPIKKARPCTPEELRTTSL